MRDEIILAIVAMAAVTFLTRFASPALAGNADFPSWVQRFLKHLPTAILTALIAPALLAPQGYLDISGSNGYLLAGAVAALLAYFRLPPLATMGGGMAVMLLIRSFNT